MARVRRRLVLSGMRRANRANNLRGICAVMLPRNGLIVVLLACALSACDSLSRYLAGMDDPTYFTWERSAAAHEEPSPSPTRTPAPTGEARQPLSALIGAATLAPPEAPVPRESAAPSASPA